MKWVGLASTLIAALLLSVWLRRHNSQAAKVWVLVGLLPSLMTFAHLVMAFISVNDALAHYVHGAEFSVLDGLALALYFSLPARRHSLPFRLAMSLYFIAVVLSVLLSPDAFASLFYVWQLARMFLIYAVVARGTADPWIAPAILTGMAIGLFLQVPVMLWQKFVLHVLQANGTYDAQNILGLNSHFIVLPMFALFLTRQRGWLLPGMVVLAGVVVELLTASRATIGLAAAGYAGLFTLSALRQWTSRKALMALIGVAVIAALAPVALSLVEVRSSTNIESSDTEREAFKAVAMGMIWRHPFGVGANNYVVIANVEGFNAAANVPFEGWHAFVHNVYLLVAAETGFFGLFAFLFLLIQPMIVAFLCGWRNPRDPRGDLLLGFGVALLTVYIHSLFEWVLLSDLSQYVLAIEIGMVAGLAEQLGYWRKAYPRHVPSHVGTLSSNR